MPDKEQEILVSVLCPTYNQVSYIKQCLDSVLSQKTSFKYEVLINDDCSTDGTKEIVASYAAAHPDKIRAFIQEENQYSQGVDIVRDILLKQAHGKYIAICEGDDYWTNNQKLQLQADIMENEPETGLVYTYFHKYSEKKQEHFDFHFRAHEGNVYDYILASKCSIWYVTVMMRKSLMLSAPKLNTAKYFTGDVFWYYWITSQSSVRLLREYTADYRVLDTSVSHFLDKRKKIDFFFKSSMTRIYFAQHYPTKQKPRYAKLVLKKSLVNCFKYALSHKDYKLCRELHIPLFPAMSIKKTVYTIIRKLCYNESNFNKFSKKYNHYLNSKA